MLSFKKLKLFFYYFVLISFLSSKSFAKDEYFKCLEKISNVLLGQSQLIKTGSTIGTNYIKFSNINSSLPKITIKFKEKGSKKNSKTIIKNKILNKNSLGFDIFEKYSEGSLAIENTYNFIQLDSTYAFTRKEYYWSAENETQKKNYEYESSGRCIKINKKEYEIEKKENLAKKKDDKIKQTKKISTKNQTIKGERSMALSWQGYDDLILGKIKFSEKDLVGFLEFKLPNNDGLCLGTYVLSTKKGTWSIYCEKRDLNASGTLKWNNTEGTISGNGKDNEGKKIKFKVGSS